VGIWQIPGYLEEMGGILHVEGVNVIDLAEQYGTPLFIFSEARIRHNVQEIKSAFQHPLMKTRVFYASKANSNLAVLQIIRDAGLDVEVNSGGELYKALKVGFRPDQIIFNGVAKTEGEISEAVERQIFCINVESFYELEQILRMARSLGTRANIALRMVPEVEIGTYGGIGTGTHATKFGISEDELLDSCREALRHPEHLSLIGLHMHIGAQIFNPEKYRAGFKALLTKAAALYEATGHWVSHLNMGGGLPVSFIKEGDEYLGQMMISDPGHQFGNVYAMMRADTSPKDIAKATIGQLEDGKFSQMLDSIGEGFRKVLPDICIILEPGTRVVADTAVLLTTVQNYKERRTKGDTWLLLDAGFNTLLDACVHNWYFHAIAANKTNSRAERPYKLAGPLCDSGDVYHDSEGLGRLPDYRMLPDEMKPGDVIAFLDVGAYTLEQMCQYNGQPRAAAFLIRQGGGVQVIRRRETCEDLVSYDVSLSLNLAPHQK
jgi:diaminopimelate decarboxylase